MLALDEDLRNLHMTRVKDDDLPIEHRLEQISRALDKRAFRPVAYWALADVDTARSDDYHGDFEHIDSTLREAALLADRHYLGCYVSNGRDLWGSCPRYSFRDYVGMEDLPRVAICPGPHGYPCECLACTQFDERLQRNRERADADGGNN